MLELEGWSLQLKRASRNGRVDAHLSAIGMTVIECGGTQLGRRVWLAMTNVRRAAPRERVAGSQRDQAR